jgi:hypothetical protein
MNKFYAIVLLVLVSYLQLNAQSVSYFSPQNVCLGTVQKSYVSFNGTFNDDNKFTIQIRPYYSESIIAEVPATLKDGYIEAIYTDSLLATYRNLQGRLVASSPYSVSSWSYFDLHSRGAVSITSALSDTLNSDDYLYVTLAGYSSSYVDITFSDSSRTSIYPYSNNSFSTRHTLAPSPNPVFIVRATNQCGVMAVGGVVKPVINPVSIRTTSFTPTNTCEGTEVKVSFTTMGGSISPQARYKLRFTTTNSSNGTPESVVEIDAVLRDGYLVARVPSVYRTNDGYRSEVKVQVIVSDPKIVGSIGENTLYVYPKPAAEFLSSSGTINVGQQHQVVVKFKGLPPYAADLGDGLFVNSNYSDAYRYIQPYKTTSYVLKDFSTGCGPSALDVPQTMVVTVNPGIRLLSEGSRQILCTDTKSRIQIETNGSFSDATVYRVHANLYGNFTYSFPATRSGDYLEFTIPSLPESTNYELSYDNLSNLSVTSENPYLGSVTSYNSSFVIQQKPFMTLEPYINLNYDTPGRKNLSYTLRGGSPFIIEDSNGKKSTYSGIAYFDIYLDKTQDFTLKSISNSCAKTENPVSTRVTLNPTSNTGIYLNIDQKPICITTDSVDVTILTTGSFGEGNVFAIQGKNESGVYQTLKTVTSPGTYKVKLPTQPSYNSNAYIRITSNNPVHFAERDFLVHSPLDYISISPSGSTSYPYQYIQQSSPIHISPYTNGNPINSLVYTDGQEEKTVTFDQNTTGFYVSPPSGKTTTYTIKSVTNHCETRATNLSTVIQVQPYSLNLSYDISNKFCVGQPIEIPIYTSIDPGNATFSLQLAPQNGNTFTTILTSTDKFRVTGVLPASVEPGNYNLRIISSDGAISDNIGITVNGLPSAILSYDLPNPVEIDGNSGIYLKVAMTGNGPWWVTDNSNTKISSYYSPTSYWVSPRRGQEYTLKSVYNSCGYGTVSGSVSIKVKPYLSIQSNQYTICEGSDLDLNYELRGDADLTNDYIRFELLELNSGRKTTLDSTKTLSGTRVLKIPTNLPNGYYQIRATVRSSNLVQAFGVSVTTKADVTLRGNTIVNSGDIAYLYLTNNAASYSDTRFILSDGTTGSIYGGIGSATSIAVRPSQTTTYTVTSVSNLCGTGKTAGTATVEVNPPSDRTVSVNSWATPYNSLCPGDTMQVYFLANGSFSASNVMTVQISDTTGRNFRNLPTIGSSSPLRAAIPTDLFPEKNYSIRVVASDEGSASGAHQSFRTARNKAKVSFVSDVFFYENQGTAKLAVALEGSKPITYTVVTDASSLHRYNINSSTDTISVTQVSPNLYYRITGVFNGCGNGVIGNPSTVRVELITGEPEEEAAITMAPNPTSDFVHLKFATAVARTINLFSVQGVPLYQKSTRNDQEQIDLQRLSSGIYILTIESKGKTVTYKVIKN